jgi:hypothetical protein
MDIYQSIEKRNTCRATLGSSGFKVLQPPQEILTAGAATKRRADCDWAEKPPPTLPR